MYALIEDGQIARINIQLPTAIGNIHVPEGATGLEDFGLYPMVGDEPTCDPVRERVAGPQYQFDGVQVNRVFTIEAIPDEEEAARVRKQRNTLLADWVDRMNPLVWETMTDEAKQDYRDYRQALLDVTDQPGFPWDVQWPETPSELAKKN